MKKRIVGAALLAVAAPLIPRPALAWTPSGCYANPLPPWAKTAGGKDYCKGVKAAGGNNNTNTNNNSNSQGQAQQQNQGQTQTAQGGNSNAALNARLNQANAQTASVSEVQQQYVGPANSSGGCDRATVFANIAPQQDVNGRTHYYPYGGVTVPLGRRSATCDYIPPHDAPVAAAAPVINVNVPPAPTVAPTLIPSIGYLPPPAPTVVYVAAHPKCRHISDHEAGSIARDLRRAKHTYDAARVQRDLDALYAACRGTEAAKAVDGP